MTGRSLMRRLLTNSLLSDRWGDPTDVPLGARPILEAVCELVAGSGGGELVLDPELDANRTLVQLVARRARAVGAEVEVERHLQALLRAGLLLIGDAGGLRVALPERAAAAAASERKRVSNQGNSRYSVGPRPAGMSDEAWAAKRAEKRRLVDGQLSLTGLTMSIEGGLAGEAIRSQGASHLGVVPKASDADGGGFGSPGLASAGYRDSAAAAASLHSGSIEESAAAAAFGTAGHVDAVALDEANSAKPNPVASVASPDAVALAREGTVQFGWDPSHAHAAQGIMQGYLAGGYSAVQVRAALADKATATCTGARYLGKPLERLFPTVRHGVVLPVAKPAAVLKPVDPTVAADPEWSARPYAQQLAIGQVLEKMAMPASQERHRRLSFDHSYNIEAFRAVAERKPELWEMIDKDPELRQVG